MPKSRHELKFTIVYSMVLESMMATLMGRADRWLTFGQILLGAAVVSQFAPVVFGVAVMVIGAMQFVWQFGAVSKDAMASHDRWRELYYRSDELSDAELNGEVKRVSERDNHVLRSLKLPAQIKASRQLGLSTDGYPAIRWWQKLVVFCAGGLG